MEKWFLSFPSSSSSHSLLPIPSSIFPILSLHNPDLLSPPFKFPLLGFTTLVLSLKPQKWLTRPVLELLPAEPFSNVHLASLIEL